ncbi:helix-turn-helix transcriptional regulator [Pseudothioclava arenosa]|uniref:AlpA family transcriptional regulator n=1 Tax=Pseudothioclava arenosa TaxID=1795308 RepID=A0A2A4CVN9_9RHOB|nr:helix-turn-helix domain-containing protein [Pseudothioclava arenosa]PCD78134.1 AlpA family transcriptional regulator [Pseudothioclava arenosa]
MEATNPEQFFLSVEQVATRYGVSTDSIWRWRSKGSFPAPVRIGDRSTRWRLSDLLEYEETLQACFAMDAGFSFS